MMEVDAEVKEVVEEVKECDPNLLFIQNGSVLFSHASVGKMSPPAFFIKFLKPNGIKSGDVKAIVTVAGIKVSGETRFLDMIVSSDILKKHLMLQPPSTERIILKNIYADVPDEELNDSILSQWKNAKLIRRVTSQGKPCNMLEIELPCSEAQAAVSQKSVTLLNERCVVLRKKKTRLICFNCCKYGHKSIACANKQICPKCNQEGHGYKDCRQRVAKCLHCSQDHLTTSSICPHNMPKKKQSEQAPIAKNRAIGAPAPNARADNRMPRGNNVLPESYAQAAARQGPRPLSSEANRESKEIEIENTELKKRVHILETELNNINRKMDNMSAELKEIRALILRQQAPILQIESPPRIVTQATPPGRGKKARQSSLTSLSVTPVKSKRSYNLIATPSPDASPTPQPCSKRNAISVSTPYPELGESTSSAGRVFAGSGKSRANNEMDHNADDDADDDGTEQYDV